MLYNVVGDAVQDKQYSIFCQLVACSGKIENGFSQKIRNAYPEVYNAFLDEYEHRKQGLGNNLYVRTSDNRVCVSMYCQYDYGNGAHVDVGGLAMCLEKMENKLNISRPELKVGFPKIDNEDWELVESMLETLSEKVKQEIYIVYDGV